MSLSITHLITGFPRPDGHLGNCHHRWIPAGGTVPTLSGSVLVPLSGLSSELASNSSASCRSAVRGWCFEHEMHQHLGSLDPGRSGSFFAEGDMIILAQKQTNSKGPKFLIHRSVQISERDSPSITDKWGQVLTSEWLDLAAIDANSSTTCFRSECESRQTGAQTWGRPLSCLSFTRCCYCSPLDGEPVIASGAEIWHLDPKDHY